MGPRKRPITRLSSESNPAFRSWLKLATQPRAIRDQGQTLAEGLHLAEAAAAAKWPVAAALVRHGAGGAALDAALARLPATATVYELTAGLYDRVAPVEHGSGLTLLVPVRGAEIPQASRHDLMYLDGVQDPNNVGALLRTAAAAGIGHALCGPGTAAAWSPRVMRAAMGAHFRIAISEGVMPGDLPGALDGRWIATVAHGATSLWECDFGSGAVGWAVGSEGAGLSEEALACCTLHATIPIAHAIESLNVAAAAAICLFERQRRRQAILPLR